MVNMFFGASAFNQPIENWGTVKVTSMEGMFRLASSFDQPIGNWNTAAVTSVVNMFFGASAFNQKLCWTHPPVEERTRNIFSGSGCSLSCFSPPGTCA
jgi:surface protein